jgi:hypothetical protein
MAEPIPLAVRECSESPLSRDVGRRLVDTLTITCHPRAVRSQRARRLSSRPAYYVSDDGTRSLNSSSLSAGKQDTALSGDIRSKAKNPRDQDCYHQVKYPLLPRFVYRKVGPLSSSESLLHLTAQSQL